jgi:hypothetical protein
MAAYSGITQPGSAGVAVTVLDNGNGTVTIDAGAGQVQDAIRPLAELATKTTSPDLLLDYIPIFEASSGNILKINKQTLVQNEVLYNNGALSGTVPAGKELGIDTATGTFYYKDSSGVWAAQPVGTTTTLLDNADGTVTMNAGLGGVEKAIRPMSELPTLTGAVDSSLDKVILYDASTSSHTTVSVSSLVPATTNATSLNGSGQLISTVNGVASLPLTLPNQKIDVLTTVQPTPTATGNTTNLNTVFKDALGDTWVIDSNGDAVKAGSSSKKFRIVQNLAIGANVIAHNLGLVAPFAVQVDTLDDATGALIASRVTGETANTTTITATVASTNVRITILG